MANVSEVNESEWDAEVLKSETPVLVDFWAPWCGPCRALAPTVEAIAQELNGRMKVVKLNIDEAGALAGKYGVQSIPTLALFKGGQVVHQIIGAGKPKQRMIEELEPKL
jgi:thioredoxin 1